MIIISILNYKTILILGQRIRNNKEKDKKVKKY